MLYKAFFWFRLKESLVLFMNSPLANRLHVIKRTQQCPYL